VRKVPDSDLPLLVNVGDEWAAVVDTEVEDTMLVGCLEPSTKNGSVLSLRNWGEIEAVKRREHAELKLDVIVWSRDEGSKVVIVVFRYFDLEVLLPN
jgi:hypothetical protein